MKKIILLLVAIVAISLYAFYYYLESAGPLPAESFITKEDLLSPTNIKLYNVKLNKFSSINQNGEISENEVEHTFSFIIPVHNTAQYLKEAVESIISQQIESYEIIMVENNSTDNSLEVCKDLAHNNNAIKVITQTNGGAGGARNTGLLNAKGKYILYLDSDDFYEPNALNESEILKLKEYDIIVFGYNAISAEGDKFLYYQNLKLENKKSFQSIDYHNKGYLSLSLCNDSVIAPWNKIYKRKFLIERKLFFPNKLGHQDYYIALKLSTENFKGFAINEPWVNYRVDRINSITNSSIKMYDIFYVLESFKLYLEEEELYTQFKDALFYQEFGEIYMNRITKLPVRNAYQWLKFMHKRYKTMSFNLPPKGVKKRNEMRSFAYNNPFYTMLFYILPKKLKH